MMKKSIFFILILNFVFIFLNAQEDSIHLIYPIKKFDNPLLNQKYNSPLFLKTPSVFSNDVQFDPLTGGFLVTPKVGKIKISHPYLIDFDTYNRIRTQSILSKNWQSYNEEKNSDNDFLDNFLSPKLNLGIKGMDKIFGSDNISVIPNGNIDLNFGVSYYSIDNPVLPKRSRRNLIPEFTQDIQLGVNGKVGTKMNVGINYNTKSMFDFENRKKIEYNGGEDEIIQKIEAGNITFPLDNTLISGSSTLFGIRADLKFGKLSVTTVLSQQKGQSKTIEVQSGAVLNDFQISAGDYEADRHFFLNHYFRDNYEKALQNLPVVASNINITRIEVWVTNKTSNFENARNIVAFQDLGEDEKYVYAKNFINGNPSERYPDNSINDLYSNLTNNYSSIRDISNVSNLLSTTSLSEGIDYVKLESARKLSPSEYTVNTSLGYISLNYQLRPGEVLAVAYEYTIDGKTYQVGEFSNDIDAPNTLILKLLRGPASIPNVPNWDLMMKNIYSLGTYSLSKEDFQMEIYYNDDRLGTKTNYIPEGKIAKKRLLSVFNFDNADAQNNPHPDGFFDFIEGVTVDTKNGLIIFPELEPFGNFLRKKIGDDRIAKKYTFQELYDSTQYVAQQNAVKNKFYLKGKYKSSAGNEIMLNVMNLPQGAVKVTQGGVQLQENVDYSVDYNIGKVTILNESLLRSGMPIKISIESNDQYGLITKNLIGTHLNYQFNPDFNIGATAMHLSELPIDPKTRFGEEPIANSIYGFNTNYSTNVPFLTKLVDAIPFIQTKAPSRLSITAEFAQLIPGNPRIIDRTNNEKDGVSFIDDFEDCQSYIDLKAPQAWVLSSVPQGQPNLFPEASDGTTLKSGFNRALLAWYEISDDLTQNSTVRPSYLTADDLSNNLVRQVYEKEIFPNRQNPYGTPPRLSVLNLAFYPSQRGPYNFDVAGVPGISAGINADGTLKQPQTRWGGIMRDMYVNDFESSNIGFIEFWIMDPFIYDSTSTGGDLYLDLGDISEDILKDSRKSIENGIPYPPDPSKVDTTQWGIVSKLQMTTQNFDNNPAARKIQDAGFDGLTDSKERRFFHKYLQQIAAEFGVNSKAYQKAIKDPSDDDFRYFLDNYYDSVKAGILDRYKKFNGVEGNSPINTGNNKIDISAVTQYPDMEDVNRDNTLDTYEAYYQYHLHLSPEDMQVGKNHIVNKVVTKALGLPNKNKNDVVTWYQIKIPIHSPDKIVGNVQGFKSIRFMRLFMRGFKKPIVLRLAKFDLIRDEWRQYEYRLSQGGEAVVNPQQQSDGSLDISVVNIEESTQKQPVNYLMPPGVSRNNNFFGEQVFKENEQSMSLKVIDLPDGEAKAVYKNVDMDLRKFKYLKMFVHEEALINQEADLKDNDLTLFVRIGSDFTENYYEYEIHLKKTPAGTYYSAENDLYAKDRYIVWPTENNLNLDLEKLVAAKQERNVEMSAANSTVSYNTPFTVYDGKNKITVLGNPNLANVKSIMIGIRNPRKENNVYPDDGLPKSAEIWVNELRLTGFNSQGGWAANLRINANLADFGNVTFSGYMHTPGFGSIEQRVNERYIDQAMEYDFTSQFQLGKFFPKKYRVSIPLYFGISNSISNPQYNPFDPDIKFRTALSNPNLTPEQRASLKNSAQTFTMRRSFNLTNINIQGKQNKRDAGRNRLIMPWKISNFSASFSYNEIYSRNPIIEYNIQQSMLIGLNYNYSPNPRAVQPFRKIKLFRRKAFQILRDFNFYYLPTRLNLSSEINRQYTTFKNRSLGDENLSLPASFQKNFLWKRNYDFTYKLTRSMRIDFTATDEARVEPEGWRDHSTLFQQWGMPYYPRDSVFMNVLDLGRNTDYNQRIRINYRTPINKLPLLRWTSLTIDYSANYNWRRGQDPLPIPATDTTPAYTFNFGNMAQNTSVLRLDGRLDFLRLYRGVKYLSQVQRRFTRNGRTPIKRRDKTVKYTKQIRLRKKVPRFITHNLKTANITKVEIRTSKGKLIKLKNYTILSPNRIKIVPDTTLKDAVITIEGKRKMSENPFIVASDYILKSMMMLQSVNFDYKKSGGTLLNGYMPEAKILGSQKIRNMWAPGWDFLAGLQDRLVLNKYSSYGWITVDTMFNMPMNFTSSEEMRMQVNLEPLNNVRINLNFQRNITLNETKYGYSGDNDFLLKSRMKNGNFYISFNTIKTAFENISYRHDSTLHSVYYDKFLQNRQKIAFRYADMRHHLDPNYSVDTYTDSLGKVYPVGYSETSQNVLIGAFLSAYSGISPDKIELSPFLSIPFPDWRITFDGLSNLPFIKQYVKKITLTHAYSSTYTINNFNSNPNYNFDMFDQMGISDAMYASNGLFIPQYEVSGIMLSEKFVPFLGIDITWIGTLSTRFEYKRARDLYLSFSNNQLRERHNNTFTIGAGYTIKNLNFDIRVGGKAQKLRSDLNLRLDVSGGHDIEVYRKIVENFAQVNTERNTFNLSFTADYSINSKLSVQFYYSHSIMQTNTAPRTVNAQGGFKIRYAISQ
jgi:cell surface protein SprA